MQHTAKRLWEIAALGIAPQSELAGRVGVGANADWCPDGPIDNKHELRAARKSATVSLSDVNNSDTRRPTRYSSLMLSSHAGTERLSLVIENPRIFICPAFGSHDIYARQSPGWH
jgi:hypothetical protein